MNFSYTSALPFYAISNLDFTFYLNAPASVSGLRLKFRSAVCHLKALSATLDGPFLYVNHHSSPQSPYLGYYRYSVILLLLQAKEKFSIIGGNHTSDRNTVLNFSTFSGFCRSETSVYFDSSTTVTYFPNIICSPYVTCLELQKPLPKGVDPTLWISCGSHPNNLVHSAFVRMCLMGCKTSEKVSIFITL